MTVHQTILKQYWGHGSFRPLQEEIILSVLAGKDTLALLPTGGGKSLCFQVPAMMMDGLCLVISPLIALMKDQVETLRAKGITAFAVYSGMTRKEVAATLKVAASSNCKFLYVSPERLETKLFLDFVQALRIRMIAVDEAHCISQWGYDFRPPYLRIARLRELLPRTPVLALTASATPTVQNDICSQLKFTQPAVFRQSFERPNLSYSVFHTDSKILKLVDILKKVPGSSIVYCRSRKRTREIAAQLLTYGINAGYYHAGLTAAERDAKQESWIKNHITVIVCTNAFGMGIDKPDVRTVVHIDAPDSLENYYQEAGRAGRDRNKAYAVLLYRQQDIADLAEQVNQRFPAMADIRTVYQSIVNYLQIPTGIGEGNYYDFDLTDFLPKFRLTPQLVVNALKVLEQENVITFNEQALLPSRVMFTCNKDLLYAFEKAHPTFEPVIKTLLRTYEGIFDQQVIIHEKPLAYQLRMPHEAVTATIEALSRHGIISYRPPKDTPQLFFAQHRVKAEDLTIDYKRYNERKQTYKTRVETFISYIRGTGCRSKFTGNYFGDDHMKPCGICDNCLRSKQAALSAGEFSAIQQQVLTVVRVRPVSSTDLLQHLVLFKKEQVWKVIAFLQAENKITVDGAGKIIMVNGQW